MTESNHSIGATSDLPVAVLGAGPTGLAAAAHLLERGLKPVILEQGDVVGHSIREWGHVRLFSPWSECLDLAAVRLLETTGWTRPDPTDVPLGIEVVNDYLEPLAAVPSIAKNLRLSSKVVAVTRKGRDKVGTTGRNESPFIVRIEGPDGRLEDLEARAVIDATGTWSSPNPMGSSGIPAIGETDAADRIFYGMPDLLGSLRSRYASKKVLVIGGGHSAANALLDLALLQTIRPDTEIHWAIRAATPNRYYGGEDADALEGRGALGRRLHDLVDSGRLRIHAGFRTTSVTRDGESVVVRSDFDGITTSVRVDEVIVCTGSRPDFSFLRELRLSIDPSLECVDTLAPLIDPNVHSCGSVRPHGERELRHGDAGFYIAGMKSYGRAPTFLLLTGHEQVRSIVASIAGDQEAADRVELVLPETGVCSSDLFVTDSLSPERLKQGGGDGAVAPDSSCCGSTPEVEEVAVGASTIQVETAGAVKPARVSSCGSGGCS